MRFADDGLRLRAVPLGCRVLGLSFIGVSAFADDGLRWRGLPLGLLVALDRVLSVWVRFADDGLRRDCSVRQPRVCSELY